MLVFRCVGYPFPLVSGVRTVQVSVSTNSTTITENPPSEACESGLYSTMALSTDVSESPLTATDGVSESQT